MEEWIGKLWHRWITRAAGGHHPQAAVTLKSMNRPLAIYFRALGGDPGLRVAAATADEHESRRHWRARLAGSGERISLARQDCRTLRLPPMLDVFPDAALNRDLYYWLAALAACMDTLPAIKDDPFGILRNQAGTCSTLARWPGLGSRYHRLVEAYLPFRQAVEKLPPEEAAREIALRTALSVPGSTPRLPDVPPGSPPHQPVLLWLHVASITAHVVAGNASNDHAEGSEIGLQQEDAHDEAHRVERVDNPAEKHGLLMYFRAESLLSIAEFVRVNRSVDDEPEASAADLARDMNQLSLANPEAGERIASKVRFDLDLPSAAEDDIPLGAGIPLPEWDYRTGELRSNYVRLQEMASRHAVPQALPLHLRRTARRLQQQFAALQPTRRWLKGQPQGGELDLDAIVRAHGDRLTGRHTDEQLYLSLEQRGRDLACLLLADLSLSTDAWVSDQARVIDVIRDALMLFGEAMRSVGDSFALCGFSSLRRQQVRFHCLKDFDAPFDNAVRGRIQAIKPGYYTRMGAAIRHSGQLLSQQASSRRLLILLSDGKPNDLDHYDGRYGIEDTRAAVHEVRRLGLTPFCLTIDKEGGNYLPHLFGSNGYTILRNPSELPSRLPLLYTQISGQSR
ncbi:MAG: nitric oxide reductase [Dechloromonas sp.]|nr:nitric oxide reductase [Dechloromonas sp.]